MDRVACTGLRASLRPGAEAHCFSQGLLRRPCGYHHHSGVAIYLLKSTTEYLHCASRRLQGRTQEESEACRLLTRSLIAQCHAQRNSLACALTIRVVTCIPCRLPPWSWALRVGRWWRSDWSEAIVGVCQEPQPSTLVDGSMPNCIKALIATSRAEFCQNARKLWRE